jgi:hypothetical protein
MRPNSSITLSNALLTASSLLTSHATPIALISCGSACPARRKSGPHSNLGTSRG